VEITELAVVSFENWTIHQSHRLRGYPAAHALRPDGITLCGRKLLSWSDAGDIGDVNCKHCLRKLAAQRAVTD
jgi:hypothetical protein